MICMLTKREEVIIYDMQKGRVLNYLVSHFGQVVKIMNDERSRVNIFTLGTDCRIIHWKYTADKWLPKVFDFKRMLRE